MSQRAAARAKSAPSQLGVLTERTAMCLLADWRSVLLLVGQAPLIGWFCSIVWGDLERDTPTLWFVLALAAVWFGCVTSCREIVKERAIWERERLFGLRLWPTVLSKLIVFSLVGLVQVTLLQCAVEMRVQLRGPMGIEILGLWAAATAGVALGLCVSALVSSEERAVFAVPLLLLPQILFSEFAIPKSEFGPVVNVVEKLMPVRWAFRVYDASARTEADYGEVVLSFLVLALFSAVFATAAVLALWRRRDVR